MRSAGAAAAGASRGGMVGAVGAVWAKALAAAQLRSAAMKTGFNMSWLPEKEADKGLTGQLQTSCREVPREDQICRAALDGEGSATLDSAACNRGNGMSSFPGDTQEMRESGECGVSDAGSWALARCQPLFFSLRSKTVRNRMFPTMP